MIFTGLMLKKKDGDYATLLLLRTIVESTNLPNL